MDSLQRNMVKKIPKKQKGQKGRKADAPIALPLSERPCERPVRTPSALGKLKIVAGSARAAMSAEKALLKTKSVFDFPDDDDDDAPCPRLLHAENAAE